MFGISFTELTLVVIVALVVVGPEKLPTMLRTLGRWVGTARRFTSQVRVQTGIDELLREEGIAHDLSELRGMLKGSVPRNILSAASSQTPQADPYLDAIELDQTREYPIEGADALGALPDDLAVDVPSDIEGITEIDENRRPGADP